MCFCVCGVSAVCYAGGGVCGECAVCELCVLYVHVCGERVVCGAVYAVSVW
jgi:hypothetical protein